MTRLKTKQKCRVSQLVKNGLIEKKIKRKIIQTYLDGTTGHEILNGRDKLRAKTFFGLSLINCKHDYENVLGL